MTDYKKLYEEAIFRMNKWVEGSEIIDPKEVAEFVFPELKESEDERIRKEMLNVIKQFDDDSSLCGKKYNYRKWIAWLEKQGKVNDYSLTMEDEKIRKELLEHCINRSDGKQVCVDASDYRRWADWLYRQAVENIPNVNSDKEISNKIEPKFNVGDWVACNQELCFESPICIKDIDNNNYRVESVDGCSGVPTINYLDNYYHLYTIKDAKDGDVLVYEGEIFIIKFYVLWHKIVYHCCYDGKNLHKYSIYDSWRKEDFDKVHPATKEQRDLLFSKMKEAGYKWNADKKELKKIEQNPTERSLPYEKNETAEKLIALAECLEMDGDCLFNGLSGDDYGKLLRVLAIELTEVKSAWSKDDEIGLNDALWAIEKARTIAKDETDMGNLWYGEHFLNSIKERVQPQPKQGWSEEDEHRVGDTIYFLETAKKHYASDVELNACIDWLKSLKDRI